MTNKLVLAYDNIKDKILEGVDMLANPVKQTLSPKGGNVIFSDDRGNIFVTNDGVTIAKNINPKDNVHSAVVDIVRHSSLKTNSEAGDGTTTSILLSQVLIREGFKLLDEGVNPIELKKMLEASAERIIERLSKKKLEIKNDDELFNVATISANNDTEIAKNVVDVVKFAGEDGMVFIEPNNKQETEITKEPGFKIDSGMFSPDLRQSKTSFTARYENVPVLITDKRIYYPEEAETILRTAVSAGHKTIVVVARDFIGQSPMTFIANHNKGIINVLLVKDTKASENNSESLDDLAIYLGGKVVKEKLGSLVNKVTADDFVMVNSVFSDHEKTIFTPTVVGRKEVTDLVEELKKELEKDKDNEEVKKRISCLTNGTTTIRVGGSTPIEQAEKIYRYEDAINATRSAMKYGYLVGGGVSLLRSFNAEDHDDIVAPLIKRMCHQSLRQIAINCGKNPDEVVKNVLLKDKETYGYNALTDIYEDVLKAGVLDPYRVVEMTVRNSISVANVILSSKYLIVNDIEEKEK